MPLKSPEKPTRPQKTVAYVGPFLFPSNSACSLRVAGISLVLNSAGYNVLIGSGQRQDNQTIPQKKQQGIGTIQVTNLAEFPDPRSSKPIKALRGLTWGGSTLKWLTALEHKPTAVIVYGAHLSYLLRLIPWCHKEKIPLLVDMVEWFQPTHLPGGIFGPFALAFEISTRFFVAKAANVITISRFLENYYKLKNCSTIRIPPIFDVHSISAKKCSNKQERLTVTYVGVPHKKDLLDNAIDAVLRVDTTGNLIQFIIAGPSTEDLLKLPSLASRNLTTLPASIKSLGRITHEKAMDTVRQADFSVLLRPQLRYAKAGFPSKVVESLALGTPLICNISGDLQDYISDGAEALISADHTANSCAVALKRGLSLSRTNIIAMQKSARNCALKYFDYTHYTNDLDSFLKKAIFNTLNK